MKGGASAANYLVPCSQWPDLLILLSALGEEAMKPTVLLIITGHPATGKTTLARALAAELAMPLVSKDTLKESMFDSLGCRDRAWARQVGAAAIMLLYRIAEELLAVGQPLIVESNFRADLDTSRMLELQQRHPFRPVQLRCIASPEVMVARYLRRIAAGERHPGHCETPGEADIAMMRHLGHIEPLLIGGSLLTVDTTEPDTRLMATAIAWARAHCAGEAMAEFQAGR